MRTLVRSCSVVPFGATARLRQVRLTQQLHHSHAALVPVGNEHTAILLVGPDCSQVTASIWVGAELPDRHAGKREDLYALPRLLRDEDVIVADGDAPRLTEAARRLANATHERKWVPEVLNTCTWLPRRSTTKTESRCTARPWSHSNGPVSGDVVGHAAVQAPSSRSNSCTMPAPETNARSVGGDRTRLSEGVGDQRARQFAIGKRRQRCIVLVGRATSGRWVAAPIAMLTAAAGSSARSHERACRPHVGAHIVTLKQSTVLVC